MVERGGLVLPTQMRGGSGGSSGAARRSLPYRLLRQRKALMLLLSCCLACALLLLLLLSTGWIDGPSSSSLRGSSSTSSFLPPGEGYTVLMNTWKRNELLKQSVAHYASCPGVESIHVVWSEPDPPSDSLHDALLQTVQLSSKSCNNNVELQFDLNQEDSLNNRFKGDREFRTDAIFSVDDDVLFPCSSMELAFSLWRSAPSAMVGFVPRIHWLDNSKTSEGYYRYGGWWSVWWRGTYSMVLSKAAFFHKKYLHLYTKQMPASIRDYVTEHRNCEDIAMSLLIANETGAPPVWVKGRIFEIGSSGISSLGGHSKQRTECLNIFAAAYGRMPLVASNVKVVDGRLSWLW